MSKVKVEIFIFALVALPLYVIMDKIPSFTNIILIISPIVNIIIDLMLTNLSAQIYKAAENKLENIIFETSQDVINSSNS